MSTQKTPDKDKGISVEVKEIGSYDVYFEHGDKDIEWVPGVMKYQASTKTVVIQREPSELPELKLRLVIGITSVRKEEDEADDTILFLKLLNGDTENEYINLKVRTSDTNWRTMFIKFLSDLCPSEDSPKE